MEACEVREGRARLQACEHIPGRGSGRRRVLRAGDEDVAEEILVAFLGPLAGPGQEPVDFRVTYDDPVEDLLSPQTLRDEIVADPCPELRERYAARLERTAQVRHGGVVPPGNGFDGPVEHGVRDAKAELLGHAELQPLEDQLVQRTANQRIAGGKSGGGLSKVEDDLAESPLDLAHQYGVAVDHRRNPVQLGRRGRRNREEKGGGRRERDAGRTD